MTLAANDPFAAFKRLQFSNGLQAFVLTMPGRTAEHVQFVLNVGAGDDPDAFLGLAHYTEHMVCCDNEMTIARLSSYFENEGGDFDACTSDHYTRYGFSAPIRSKKFSDFFNFWAKKFMQPVGTVHLENQRAIIRQEYQRCFNSAEERCFEEKVQSLVYSGTVYGRQESALGTAEGISNISAEAVSSFVRDMYTPSNVTIVAVGGLTVTEVTAYIRNSGLLDVPQGCVRTPRPRVVDTHPVNTSLRAYFTSDNTKYSAEKADVSISIALPGTVSFDALKLVRSMLSHNLILLLRDRSEPLTYTAGAVIRNMREMYSLNIMVDAVVPESVPLCHTLVGTAIAKLADRELFGEMQQRELARLLMVDMNMAEITSAVIDDLVWNGRPVSIEEQMRNCAGISFKEIDHLLEQLKSPRTCVVAEVYR